MGAFVRFARSVKLSNKKIINVYVDKKIIKYLPTRRENKHASQKLLNDIGNLKPIKVPN